MRLWRGTAATLLVSIVILPVAAVARPWGFDFCPTRRAGRVRR
jgi:hypothetical protein